MCVPLCGIHTKEIPNMKTIKHPVAFPDTYPLERIAPREDILFFDIETTVRP